jgi:hypothetical protein
VERINAKVEPVLTSATVETFGPTWALEAYTQGKWNYENEYHQLFVNFYNEYQ